jgi:integration host factor subunit beta
MIYFPEFFFKAAVKLFTGGGNFLMTKAELVERVANQIHLTKKQTEVVVNTVFSSITESLAEGKKVELRGFGSFRIRQRNARIGRNPKSGQKVEVPSKKVPFFKAGKELRQLVDNHAKVEEEKES